MEAVILVGEAIQPPVRKQYGTVLTTRPSQRHVKCDESQPVCHRCLSSGRCCLGYKPRPSSNQPPRVICPRPLPQSCALSDAESNAMHFFRQTTIHQLPCASTFQTAWEPILLELALRQPCIKGAVVALPSLHRFATDRQDPELGCLAHREHTKSMSLLRTYIDTLDHAATDDDVTIVLVACLLFFAFEAFAAQDTRASIHVRAALRLIETRRHVKTLPCTSYTERGVAVRLRCQSQFDIFMQIFMRLNSDYVLVGHDNP